MNRPSLLKIAPCLAGLTLAALIQERVTAQISYVETELATESPFRRLHTEDLDGDGRLDIVDYRWRRGIGRELLIYHQQENGRYSPTPQLVEIKTEIIAVGFADLRSDPGKELLLLASNGAFSLSTAIEGYTGNLQPLFQWQLIAGVPDPEQVQFFNAVEDLDGDGHIDLLIPGEESYGLFRGTGAEQFALSNTLSTINRDLDPALRPRGDGGLDASIDINSRDGIKLQVTAGRPAPFAGFIETQDSAEGTTGNLLQAESWMPPALTADFNGDRRPDIVYLNVGPDIRGQLNILMQQADGSFGDAPDWQGSVDTRGDLRLAELNGDGLMDMTRLTGEGDQWDLFLFVNRDGTFDFANPDQVMRFSGYDVTLQLIDLDGDDSPELNISYYTIPVVEALRNTSIVRTQLIYGRNPDGLFNRRPAFRLEESFSASDVRGLAEQMTLRHDIDGDGRPDALYITSEGALAANRIDQDLRIAEEPFWEYVPTRSVIGFDVKDLNQDQVPDLILRHSTSFTLLVASP